ncbi:MAG: hypothetical protein H8E91_02930 [Planctomycetes bacterium]|nr:hypothetical protein [Planctomycetota bacterium]
MKFYGYILSIFLLTNSVLAEDIHEVFNAWFFQESLPDVQLQGVIAIDETTGEMTVPWAWIVEPNGISLLQLNDGGLNLPHVQLTPLEGNDSTMLLEVDPYGYRTVEQPVPESLVLLDQPLGDTTWRWNGIAFLQSEIDDSMYQMGMLDVPTVMDPCGMPPSNANDTTNVYRLSDKEILIFIVNEDGTVTILIYRRDRNGCWKWSRNPDSYVPPPLPDFSFPEILPTVIEAFAAEMINGGQQYIPIEPV